MQCLQPTHWNPEPRNKDMQAEGHAASKQGQLKAAQSRQNPGKACGWVCPCPRGLSPQPLHVITTCVCQEARQVLASFRTKTSLAERCCCVVFVLLFTCFKGINTPIYAKGINDAVTPTGRISQRTCLHSLLPDGPVQGVAPASSGLPHHLPWCDLTPVT